MFERVVVKGFGSLKVLALVTEGGTTHRKNALFTDSAVLSKKVVEGCSYTQVPKPYDVIFRYYVRKRGVGCQVTKPPKPCHDTLKLLNGLCLYSVENGDQ